MNRSVFLSFIFLITPILGFAMGIPDGFHSHLKEVDISVENKKDSLEGLRLQINKYLANNPKLFELHTEETFQYFYKVTEIKRKLKKDFIKYGNHSLKLATSLDLKDKRVADLNYWLGLQLSQERKIYLAEQHLFKALEIYEKDKNTEGKFIGYLYSRIGLNQIFSGNSEKALDMLESAVLKYKSASDYKPSDLILVYDNIGLAYYNVLDHDNAMVNFQKAIDIIKGEVKTTKMELMLGDVYNHIGSSFIKQKNYADALIYYFKSLKIRKRLNTKPNNLVSDSYDGIGRIHRFKKEYKIALKYHEDALSLKEKFYKGDHADIGYSYFLRGLVYSDKNDFDLALQSFKKCMSILEKISSKKYRLYLDAYIHLARTYKAKGDLEMALKSYEEIVILKNNIRREYQNTNSSLSVINSFLPTEDALLTTYQLYEKNKNKKYLSKAFSLLEENQAGRLLDALHATEVTSFTNIPREILDLGDNLKNEISKAEIKWFEANGLNAKNQSEAVSTVYERVLEAKSQWYSYVQKVRNNYPDFYNLRLNPEIVSLDVMQQSFKSSHEAILEYFVGEKHLFILAFSKDEILFEKIRLDFPLKEWISKLRLFTSSKNKFDELSGDEEKEQTREYVEISHSLYNKLIAPIKSSFFKEKDLRIIYDGILGYIPFDILLTKKPDIIKGFRSLDYLVVKHNISYAYSANLLHLLNQKQAKSNKNVITFSPDFTTIKKDSSGHSKFEELKYGNQEISTIDSLFESQIIKGKDASVRTFKESTEDYKVIHLSTHGNADDRLGDYCYLAFSATNKEGNNYPLYVRDLYNLELSADMVVLSACETGIGELREGEGIISLGRGFTYAGAKSIISTLWSVNDRSSMEIMVKFYSNIKKGLQKDHALRRAKLDYLKETVKPHPAYWAGFTATGNMSPVQLDEKRRRYYPYLIPFIFLFLALWFVVIKF